MMRRLEKVLTLGSLLFLSSCSDKASVNFQASNALDEARPDAALIITDQKILDRWGASAIPAFTVRGEGGTHYFFGQLDDLDQDGKVDEAFFLINMRGKENLIFQPKEDLFTKIEARAQFVVAVRQAGSFDAKGQYVGGAGFAVKNSLQVPSQQEQDSGWAYMEGPLWESDRVGFRYYLDDRNRYDVFGKSQPAMVLHNIAGDYHALSEWGADILKVGKSMGLGSIAMMTVNGPAFIDNAEKKALDIVVNGPFRSILRTRYEGWQVAGSSIDVMSDLEIRGGARWTEQRLELRGAETHPMVTGIAKHHAASELYRGEEDGVFFAYTWGKQTEQGELLGMAVLIHKTYMPEIIQDDPLSHLIVYKLIGGKAHYRFMVGWEREAAPFKDQNSFEAAVRQVARRYASPVKVQ